MTTHARDVAGASAWATYRRLLGYTRRYWPVALIAVAAMIVDAGCLTLFAREIKPMLDDLFIERDPHTIFWMPIIIVTIFLVRGIASYVTDYGTAYIGRGVVQRIRQAVFVHYLRLRSAFFDRESSGHQIARITYTAEQVAQASTDAVKVAVVDGLTVLGLTGVMLYYSVRLTLALLVMAPLVAILVLAVSRRYRRIGRRIQGSMGSVTGLVEEVVGAHREVKVYGGQQYEDRRFESVTEQNRRLNLKVAATNGVATALVQVVAALAMAMIIYFATRPSMLAQISPGTFTALILAMGGILPSLKRLTTVQANLQRGVAAAQDLFGILDLPGEVDAGTVEIGRCRGDIELRDVVLTYDSSGNAALRGVGLHCAPGTVTALVGRSGSGKSSLANLIPRFYEPTSGAVLLDGRPLTDYTLASLRGQIAWVGQQVVLFNDTIGRNIAYGALTEVPRAEVEQAARAANAMEFIERLPAGLDSQVGEGGALLSGGQRQRIAIARALLKNAPILILDEATSALDTESERLIQGALNRLMRDRTVLVIAHRLSTVEHADQIIVLDAGRVVERGSHGELLARKGHYAALYHMQFRDGGDAARVTTSRASA
ncbi:MAG TPA: lipid A export permease/ATP-binding protein MsbA [Rhodanobacteraceae bacterium]|nr:lipid A export permease/ATP-binding protein MsbA [Rhodanobacteraceae bacterium]